MKEDTTNKIYNEISSKILHDESIESPEYMEYRRKWEQNPKYHIVSDFPVHLDFELTTYCNLNCTKKICALKCPYNLSDNQVLPERVFSFQLFKKVIDEGVKKGLCSIKLNYRGEPLLHPEIVDFIRYAKEKGIIDVMLNTNSSLLSEDLSYGILNSGLDKLFCTLGSTSINSVRGRDEYLKIVENIKNLISLKNKQAKFKPIITIQIFDVDDNEQNLKKFIKYWEELVDKIAIDKLNTFILKEDFDLDLIDFSCQYLWQRLFLLYNGDVVMCCGDHKEEEILGNIKNQSIESIWKGSRIEKIRKLHLNGKSGKLAICRKCGFRKTSIENLININRIN